MFKKIVTCILAFITALVLFVGCTGDSVKFIGDPENYSVIPGSFADSGLGTELDSQIDLQINPVQLERQDDSESVLARCRKSVVEIYSIQEGGVGAGSGVFIGYIPNALQDGGIALVLTCHHVIDSAYAVNVRDVDGNLTSAGLIGSDPNGDIAVLWTSVSSPVTCATFGDSAGVQVGETVYAIGNPTGLLGGTVTKGIISATQRNLTIEGLNLTLLQIDSAINNGSSGGGLFTEDGYLIGMTNAGVNYKDGLGFAIPSDIILEKANGLISTYKDEKYNTYGYIDGVISLGVTLSTLKKDYCVYISAMTDYGSFGTNGQFKVGDRIDAIRYIDKQGEEHYYEYVPSEYGHNQIFAWIKSFDMEVGEQMTLTVTREEDGAQVQIDIDLTFIQLIYRPVPVPQGVLTQLDADILTGSMDIGEYTEDFDFFLESSSLERTDDEDSVLSLIRKSVVELYATGESGGIIGNAVIIGFSPDGEGGGTAYLATCHQCIENAYYINAKDFYGSVYPTGLIGSDVASGVALLWAKLDYEPTVATIASDYNLQIGESVYAIGNPTGLLPGTVTKGIVSSFKRRVIVNNIYSELIQVDVAVNSGSSGGGLFTEDGYLIGIVRTQVSQKDGIGFAIPSDVVTSVTNSLANTYKDDVYNSFGYVEGRADVYSIKFSDSVMALFGKNAVYVSEIDQNSVYCQAGMRVGDKINSVEIKGKKYTPQSADELMILLSGSELAVGDDIVFEFVREKAVYRAEIVLLQYLYLPTSMPIAE